MNKNVIIVLAGGFVIALLVAMIVQAGLSDGKTDSGAQILVASRTLTVGHELSSVDVRWQSWPKDAVSKAMIVRKDKNQKLEDVAKGKVRRETSAGEPVLTSTISEGDGNMMAAILDPGMRAVAIKVKAESMVGGFISPGDRVDVIMAYDVKLDDRDNPAINQKVQRYASETVLENVKVLAIDQQARKEDDKAKVGRTVTLQVDAEGAEKLNLAGMMGDLSLSLRAIGDTSSKATTNKPSLTTDAQVSSVLREINRLKAQGNTEGPSRTVRVYNGEDVQSITVRKDESEAGN